MIDDQHEENGSETMSGSLEACDTHNEPPRTEEEVENATETVKEATRAPCCVKRTFLGVTHDFAENWPRLFHLLIRVLVPLLGLIGVSFFCGYLLARAESGLEMAHNDENIAETFNFTMFFSNTSFENKIPLPCLAEFDMNDENLNTTKLRDFLDKCAEQLSESSQENTLVYDTPTFDWILCGGKPMPYSGQLYHVLKSWTDNYFDTVISLIANGTTFLDANEIALLEVSGHDDCTIHTAAGALFWFTVMTTMGYGNTAPETVRGRALVYTLGFLSILLFGIVIGSAGSICLAVSDDFFLRHKLKSLTKGFASVIFWFVMLLLWLLFDAWTFILYNSNSGGPDMSLADSFWFIYISTTTVGFGDFYIDPSRFQTQDMFKFPYTFLIGFVLVANFIFKLTEWLADKLPSHGKSLEATLEAKRNAATGQGLKVAQDSATGENSELLTEAVLASPLSTMTEETSASPSD